MLPSLRTSRRISRMRRGGFSLVEIVLVLAVVSVASMIYAQTVASSRRLDPIAEETALAADATRVAIELIRARPVGEILAHFDADPSNDPGGAGTSPGSRFTVEGLAPTKNGKPVGRIEFPLIDGRLAEDLEDEMLGMPRDLSGDGVVDDLDHRADWVVLPVRVHIEWSPHGGGAMTRNFEIYTMIPRL